MAFSFKYYNTSYTIIFIFLITAGMTFLSDYIKSGEYSSLIPIPSTVAIITLLLVLYDKFLSSKWAILLDVPLIGGRYSGRLVSDFKTEDGKPIEILTKIEITQKGSGILIRQFNKNPITGKETKSMSTIEQLTVLHDGNLRLSFGYVNDGEFTQEKLTKHDGFCILDIQVNEKKISGVYFTNRNPQPTRGSIDAIFEQDEVKGAY